MVININTDYTSGTHSNIYTLSAGNDSTDNDQSVSCTEKNIPEIPHSESVGAKKKAYCATKGIVVHPIHMYLTVKHSYPKGKKTSRYYCCLIRLLGMKTTQSVRGKLSIQNTGKILILSLHNELQLHTLTLS